MGFFPETQPPRDDISCDSCNAACCRAGMRMVMDSHEAVANGLKIRRRIIYRSEKDPRRVIEPPSLEYPAGAEIWVPAGMEESVLTQDCGHLAVDNSCKIYTSPDRPQACAEFVVGSEACLYARKQAGFVD